MFYRRIQKRLEYWKDKERNKAFILGGARQVGKTYILEWFCKTNFKDYISINLKDNETARQILFKCLNTEETLLAITAIANKIKIKKDTVIFIDEVQYTPQLITILKGLILEGTYRYIISGSFLSITFRTVDSIPVGYVTLCELYPMSFEEFAIACGYGGDLLDTVRNNIINRIALPSSLYVIFTKLFNTFLVIGGMPLAVKTFLNESNYERTFKVQQDILNTYSNDFTNQERINKKLELNKLYTSIPSQLEKEYNRFSVKDVFVNRRFSSIESSIDWLTTTACAYKVNLINEIDDNLKLSKREMFKLYSNDPGLLICQLGASSRNKLMSQDPGLNLDFIYENFICCELFAKNYNPNYFNSKKNGEVQFVYNDRNIGSTIPVIIKIDTDIKIQKSLNLIISNNSNIKESHIYCKSNILVKGKMIYLPIFAISFIEENF